MKKIKIVLLTTFCLTCFGVIHLYGQNDSTIINEFNISINKALNDSELEKTLGFGVGIYSVSVKDKLFKMKWGFEYNRTSQHLQYTETHHAGFYSYTYNLNFNLNTLSAPVNFQFNFGTRTKFYIAPGMFFDIVLSSKGKGTQTGYSIVQKDSSYYYEHVDNYIDNYLLPLNEFNYGFLIAVGVKIPVSKFYLIIQPDYKAGLRNLFDSESAGTYSTVYNFYNRYFRINLGIRLK